MSWLAKRIVRASAEDEDHWITWKGPLSLLFDAFGASGGSTASGKWVTSKSALGLVTVYRCVQLLSWIYASLPLKVYRNLEAGGREIDRKHPNFPLLYARPNGWQTSFQWRQRSMTDVLLYGNTYSVKKLRDDGTTEKLIPVHPSRVTMLIDDEGNPVYEIALSGDRPPQRYSRYEMHHLWLFSLDGYTGLNPIEAHREGIGMALAAQEYAGKIFANGGLLSGILKVPGGTSPEAKAQAKKDWKEGYTGLPNAAKIAVLEGDMDYKPLAMNLVDTAWTEMKKLSREDACAIYGVPPELAQHTSPVSSWGTGVEQRMIAFLATTVDPMLVGAEQCFQRDLFMPDELDVVYPRFNRAALLRTDILTRYRVYAIGRQWGLLYADECRGNEELNPLGGAAGTTVLDPANMIMLPTDPTANLEGEPSDGNGQSQRPASTSDRRIRAFIRQVLADVRSNEGVLDA